MRSGKKRSDRSDPRSSNGLIVANMGGGGTDVYLRWLAKTFDLPIFSIDNSDARDDVEVHNIPSDGSAILQKLPLNNLVDRFTYAFWTPPADAEHVITNGSLTAGLYEHPDQHRIGLVHGVRAGLFGLRDTRAASGFGPKRLLQQGVRLWIRSQDTARYRRMDTLVANSEFTAEMMAHYYDVKVDRVIWPPVDTERYYSGDKEDYYLYLGRLSAEKGVHNIVSAFRELPDEYRLKVAGTGPQKQVIEEIADDSIEVIGYVSEGKKRELFAHARGFIQNTIAEPFGITTIEALASGTPVVAVADGNNPNLVDEGKTGIIFRRESDRPYFAPITSTKPLKRAVREAHRYDWDTTEIQQHAEKFDQRVSKKQWAELLTN